MTREQIQALGMGSYAIPKKLEAGPYAGHWAHLAKMVFTVGVMVSDDRSGHPITRWCYPSFMEAWDALDAWDGVGDPPNDWSKQKGHLSGPIDGGRYGDRRRIPDKFDNPDGTPKRGKPWE